MGGFVGGLVGGFVGGLVGGFVGGLVGGPVGGLPVPGSTQTTACPAAGIRQHFAFFPSLAQMSLKEPQLVGTLDGALQLRPATL